MTPTSGQPNRYEGRRYWIGVGKILIHIAVPLLLSLGLWALILWALGQVVGAFR